MPDRGEERRGGAHRHRHQEGVRVDAEADGGADSDRRHQKRGRGVVDDVGKQHRHHEDQHEDQLGREEFGEADDPATDQAVRAGVA